MHIHGRAHRHHGGRRHTQRLGKQQRQQGERIDDQAQAVQGLTHRRGDQRQRHQPAE